MRFPFCSHEEKVAQLLSENRWGSDPALLAHAVKCGRCSDVLLSVQMLQQSRSAAAMSARTGSPGYLWWKAQLIRQNGMLEQVTKPIVWAERMAFLIILCVVAGFAFWHWGKIGEWFSGLSGIWGTPAVHLNEIWLLATSGNNLVLLSIMAGLTVVVCIGGLALFLTDSKN